MVRVTCLSPMKSYSYCSPALAHLELLDSSIFKQRSFYSKQSSGNIKKQTKSTTKNNTPKQKERLKKNALKERAHCYGYDNVRNAENRAKTAILWEKQGCRDLNVI